MRCHSVGCGSEPNAASNAVDYAKFRSRSHRAVIRVYNQAGNVIANKPPPTAAMRSGHRRYALMLLFTAA